MPGTFGRHAVISGPMVRNVQEFRPDGRDGGAVSFSTKIAVVVRDDLAAWLPKLVSMSAAERAELPGVSEGRARQLVAGALVADAVMDLFDVSSLEICPWALREGVILDQLQPR